MGKVKVGGSLHLDMANPKLPEDCTSFQGQE